MLNYFAIPGILTPHKTDAQLAEDIIEVAADVYRIDKDLLRSKVRLRSIIEPRRMAAYYIRKQTNLSLSVIGRYIGGFDHATVLHHSKFYSNLLEYDKFVQEKDITFRSRMHIVDSVFKKLPETECWVDIKGWKGEYQISNTGKIRTANKVELTPTRNYVGYLWVKSPEPYKHFVIHKLVAEHFIYGLPKRFQVRHKDGNFENNHVNNLSIVTN